MMRKRGKDGQISLFLLLGIVLLISVAIILFMFMRKTEIEGKAEVSDTTRVVYDSHELELVKYVQGCLSPIVLRGLEIMRLQGGYISLPAGVPVVDIVDITSQHYVAIEDGKKVIRFDPTGSETNSVPYWLTPDDTIVLPDMKAELETYIDGELAECVGDFAPFREEGFIPTVGEVVSKVTLGEQVLVEVNFPIRMQRADIDYTTEEFYLVVPINFDKILTVALTLLANQANFAYLEIKTREIINHYALPEKDWLPPISASRQECKEVTWLKPDVRELLQNLIAANWNFLHLEGTRFQRQIRSDPVEQGFFDAFILPSSRDLDPNLIVDFRYDPGWGMEFDIFPSVEDRIRPSYTRSSNPIIGQFCHVEYEFYYDVKYPTVVRIKDLESASISTNTQLFFPYQGYEFSFPMDVFLCGNQPRRCNFIEFPEIDISQYDPPLEETYFCEQWNRKSEIQTIRVRDSYTNERVEGISVDYKCGSDMDICYMGTTDSLGEIKERFPACSNGEVILSKEMTRITYHPLSMYEAPEQTHTFLVEPFRFMNITVLLYDAKEYAYQVFNSSRHGAANYDPSGLARDVVKEEVAFRFFDGFEYYVMLNYPHKRGVNLTSGAYTAQIMVTGDITATPYTIRPRGTSQDYTLKLSNDGIYTGKYKIHTETNMPIVLPDLTGKTNITFHFLVDYFAEHTLTARDVLDSSFNDDGDLSVEIFEAYEILETDSDYPYHAVCNMTNIISREISGRVFEEFVGNWNFLCTDVNDYVVPYEVWSPWFAIEII